MTTHCEYPESASTIQSINYQFSSVYPSSE